MWEWGVVVHPVPTEDNTQVYFIAIRGNSIEIFRSSTFRYHGIISIFFSSRNGCGYGSDQRSCGSSRTDEWQSDCENGNKKIKTTHDIPTWTKMLCIAYNKHPLRVKILSPNWWRRGRNKYQWTLMSAGWDMDTRYRRRRKVKRRRKRTLLGHSLAHT